MIIKLTVNDNDFTQILKNFAQRIESVNNFYTDPEAELREYRNDTEKFREYWRCIADNNDAYDSIIIEKFIQMISSKLTTYCRKNCVKKTADYVLDNVKISVHKSIDGGWQNHENVYIFMNADNFDSRVICL